jgi:uncharacterized protein
VSIYLDASVVVPTLVEEATSRTVEQFLRSVADAPMLSDFTCGEVASAVSRLVRTQVFREEDGANALSDFDVWLSRHAAIVLATSNDIAQAARLVRRFDLGLRMPDALHLAICQRLGVTLVTLDIRLQRAASAFGVEVHAL